MYHRFNPEGENHARRLPAREFAWQLAYLKRNHPAWTPDDQLAAQGGHHTNRNAPPVVITIDDGYADFATVAAPLLQSHDLPATVFVTTGFVSGETWFWWDRLIWLLENCPTGERIFEFANRRAQGDPADRKQRWALWHTIADHLSVIDDVEKEATLTELACGVGIEIPATAPTAYQAMSWDQVRQWGNQGISFGAHTVNHPVLSRVDTSRSDQEIRESGAKLADETGHFPGWFCYPQGGPGDYRPETVEQVRQAGYRGCYTAFPNHHHDGDPMTLPRYSVSEDRLGFQWIMCGAEHLFMRWKTRESSQKGLA